MVKGLLPFNLFPSFSCTSSCLCRETSKLLLQDDFSASGNRKQQLVEETKHGDTGNTRSHDIVIPCLPVPLTILVINLEFKIENSPAIPPSPRLTGRS